MNAKYKKAFADLLTNPGRSALVIFSLVIGLWGVGTILVSYTILKNDLSENFIRSRPAHAILTSDDFYKIDLENFKQDERIESAEFREFLLQRIEVYPDQWLPLWLYGVEDFNSFHLAEIFQQEGDTVPENGTMLIERNGQLVSNLKLGSKARVRVDGKTIQLSISGITFDPAQAPATQDAFIYAYVNRETFTQITGEKLNTRLILRLRDVSSREEVISLVERLVNKLETNGVHLKSLEIPNFQEHPHQWQLNTILSLEGIIGFLAFVMGMVLVSQLMGSILAQQIRQVGIMKAIGAAPLSVFKIYLSMILILAMIAGIIAIPLAVASGYGFANFVADILNFDVLTTSLPMDLYINFVVLALFLPVLFSLPALLKGIKVTTLVALSDYGTGSENKVSKSEYRSSAGDQSREKFFSYSTQLAFRNLLRRKKRLLVTVAMMSLGVAIFSTGFNVRASLANFLFDSKDSMKYDVKVVFKKQVSYADAILPFENLDNIKSVESWNGGTGRLQSKVLSAKSGIGIVALPHNTQLVKFDVIRGRWLGGSDSPEFVLNQKAAGVFGQPVIGNTYDIELKEKPIRAKLVGVIKEFDAPKIYMDKKIYDRFANPDHLVNSLLFSAENRDYEKVILLKREIEKRAGASGLSVLYVMSQAERGLIIFNHLNIILSVLIFLSLLVLIVSALGMASATGINIMERTREIGVLRAIGATPQKIYNLFVTEGLVISLTGISLGLLFSLPLSYFASIFFGELILGDETRLDFTFSFMGFVITFFVTFIFGWLASRIPARKAIKVSTREALAYE
ncbi:MAG: FtsX-like permease family protein [Leptospirales bacterium]